MYTTVTDTCTDADLAAILVHIEETVPQSVSPHWTPGWRGEAEVALLDSIFSARAPYGRENTGVRAVLSGWRAYRGDSKPDDLTTLAELVAEPDLLEVILANRQRVPGNSRSKCAAVAVAAQALTNSGLGASSDFEQHTELQRAAFTAIPGLGDTTWECLLMQLGVRTDAATRHLGHFVRDALASVHGDDLDPTTQHVHVVLDAAAGALGSDLTSVEHVIWRFQHKQHANERRSRKRGPSIDQPAGSPREIST